MTERPIADCGSATFPPIFAITSPGAIFGRYSKITTEVGSSSLFTVTIPAATRNTMLERVRKLSDAVKSAREEANALEVKSQKVGEALLDYIFEGN